MMRETRPARTAFHPLPSERPGATAGRLPAGRLKRVAIAAVAAVALASAGSASACIEVGVYRDRPEASMGQLDKLVGPGVSVISTYVTVGQPVDPAVIKLAKRRKARLMVTLMIDGGKDGPKQPLFSNARIAAGKHDKKIGALARQLRASKLSVILRPMPEPNTNWYPWSGTVNGNTPVSYISAWKRVRTVVKRNGGAKVKLLWAPYFRSVPDTDENAIDQYFPGNALVDLVGTSGYNFGVTGELEWLDPLDVFQDPYIEIQALSSKPFWIAETGTTARGGNKSTWLRSLARLQKSMPRLRGVVLYDIKESSGDFRISATKPTRAATKAILATRCGKKG
jgi:hypothetical protein